MREPNHTPNPELLEKLDNERKEREAKAVPPPLSVVQKPIDHVIEQTVQFRIPDTTAANMVDKHAEKVFNLLIDIVNENSPLHPGTFMAVQVLAEQIKQIKIRDLLRN